jgi:hypothetical protein
MKIVRNSQQLQQWGPLQAYEVIDEARIRADVFMPVAHNDDDSVSYFVARANEQAKFEREGNAEQAAINLAERHTLTIYMKPESETEATEWTFQHHQLTALHLRRAELSPAMLSTAFLVADGLQAQLLDEFNRPVVLQLKTPSWWQRIWKILTAKDPNSYE